MSPSLDNELTIYSIKLKAIFNVHGLWEVIETPETRTAAGVVIDVKKNNGTNAYLFQAMPEEMMMQVANLS